MTLLDDLVLASTILASPLGERLYNAAARLREEMKRSLDPHQNNVEMFARSTLERINAGPAPVSTPVVPREPAAPLTCAKCGAERHGVTSETFVCRRCLSMDSSGVVNPYEKPPRPLEPSEDAPPTPVVPRDEGRIYPCAGCGKMRTKAEGGTVFTVCNKCWGSGDDTKPGPDPLSPPTPERKP